MLLSQPAETNWEESAPICCFQPSHAPLTADRTTGQRPYRRCRVRAQPVRDRHGCARSPARFCSLCEADRLGTCGHLSLLGLSIAGANRLRNISLRSGRSLTRICPGQRPSHCVSSTASYLTRASPVKHEAESNALRSSVSCGLACALNRAFTESGFRESNQRSQLGKRKFLGSSAPL